MTTVAGWLAGWLDDVAGSHSATITATYTSRLHRGQTHTQARQLTLSKVCQ